MKKTKKLESLKKMQADIRNVKGGIAIYDYEMFEELEGGMRTTRHLSTWCESAGHHQCDHRPDPAQQ